MRFIIPLIVLFAIGAQAQEHNRHPVRDFAPYTKSSTQRGRCRDNPT